jgi:hypothetical protein
VVTFVCLVYHYRAIMAGPEESIDYRSQLGFTLVQIDLEASDGEHSASFCATNP